MCAAAQNFLSQLGLEQRPVAQIECGLEELYIIY